MTITLQAFSLVEKVGVGPSLLHTRLEGPTEYVNARWMQSLHGFLHGIGGSFFMINLTIFKNQPLGVRPNTKPGDEGFNNFFWALTISQSRLLVRV